MRNVSLAAPVARRRGAGPASPRQPNPPSTISSRRANSARRPQPRLRAPAAIRRSTTTGSASASASTSPTATTAPNAVTDLKDSLDEATDECAAQRKARGDLCKTLGEDRYDPEFEARDFDRDFSNLTNPNPYFPLGIGNRWEYRSATEKSRRAGHERYQADR